MVAIKSFVASALFAAVAIAQGLTPSFNSTDVNALVSGTSNPNKLNWCKTQQTVCNSLCGNAHNSCDGPTLVWSCLCPNGSTPPLQYYRDSIIGNECNALLGTCLSTHAADPNPQAAQDACKASYVCGNATQDDAKAAGSAANAASQSTTMATSSGAAAATGAPASSTIRNAAPAAQTYGPGVIAIAVLGGLGLAL